ncbi:unnamed protein product [Ilex paraguariensis]|uniref:SAC9 C-terminal domain-containing protein n=1 Tax=Ilex paraguariensis TaxID=185542 RepID=A0ABC8S056_9AQUA
MEEHALNPRCWRSPYFGACWNWELRACATPCKTATGVQGFVKSTSSVSATVEVWAVKWEPNNMFTVAEYRLPEVKAEIAMYFDFPRQINSRRISFRLLGDDVAFADDPTEQEDSDFFRARPLATGLSLSNRFKLYYYADP